MTRVRTSLALACVLAGSLAFGTPSGPDLAPVSPERPPELIDDLDVASLVAAVERSLDGLARRPAEAELGVAGRGCTGKELRTALGRFRDLLRAGRSPDEAAREVFTIHRSDGRRGGPLVTGYFEPIVEGRQRREDGFVYPLYRRPPDLAEVGLGSGAGGNGRVFGRVVDGMLVPYHSRREIDGEGALSGRNLELVWLNDPIERFFLHVQGSGTVRLGDGTPIRVGYAGTNGRPYTSIGRLLRDAGFISPGETTAPAIREWLRKNPTLADEVLYANERYIFFHETPDGPVGSLGVPLTPGRSAAADLSRYPAGAVAYLDTRAPVIDGSGDPAGYRPLRRFIVLQDTGAAITGPGRIDLFFGTGEHAGLEAGLMAEKATLFLLLPRGRCCADCIP